MHYEAEQRFAVRNEVRKLLGILSTRWRAAETCEACGEKFVCGVTLRGCWCKEIKLSEAALAELKQKYKRCVCRKCLVRVAGGTVKLLESDK